MLKVCLWEKISHHLSILLRWQIICHGNCDDQCDSTKTHDDGKWNYDYQTRSRIKTCLLYKRHSETRTRPTTFNTNSCFSRHCFRLHYNLSTPLGQPHEIYKLFLLVLRCGSDLIVVARAETKRNAKTRINEENQAKHTPRNMVELMEFPTLLFNWVPPRFEVDPPPQNWWIHRVSWWISRKQGGSPH